MTCDRRLLSFYRDGGLSLDDRYELEDHLETCADCTAELRRLQRLAQVIRSLPVEPVSPMLRQDVRRLIASREQEQRERFLPAGIGRALAPAAVAASIAISTLVIFRPGALDLANEPAPVPVVASNPAPAEPAIQAPVVAGVPAVQGNPRVSIDTPPPPRSSVTEVGGPGSLPTKLEAPANPPGPIARLYNANPQIRALLGAPSPGSRTVTLLEQSFQGGQAIWRSDTREIYVLRRDGSTWSAYRDTFHPGDRVAVDAPPPPGALVPAGGFGSVWRSTPEVQKRLGWAVYEPRGSGGAIQTFERGMIVWTPHGLLYVLSNDGRWRTFPDATAL